jgi:hypothetical protein
MRFRRVLVVLFAFLGMGGICSAGIGGSFICSSTFGPCGELCQSSSARWQVLGARSSREWPKAGQLELCRCTLSQHGCFRDPSSPPSSATFGPEQLFAEAPTAAGSCHEGPAFRLAL